MACAQLILTFQPQAMETNGQVCIIFRSSPAESASVKKATVRIFWLRLAFEMTERPEQLTTEQASGVDADRQSARDVACMR